MKKVIIKYFLIVLTILPFSHVLSQSCGFGCLGLSGVYSGYSIQKYEADGLNNYFNYIINSSNSLLPLKGKYDFKEGKRNYVFISGDLTSVSAIVNEIVPQTARSK